MDPYICDQYLQHDCQRILIKYTAYFCNSLNLLYYIYANNNVHIRQ